MDSTLDIVFNFKPSLRELALRLRAEGDSHETIARELTAKAGGQVIGREVVRRWFKAREAQEAAEAVMAE